jgi:hypothetical protein
MEEVMSNNWKPTEAQFLTDVKAHEMTILRDDGVYRHLRFAKPGTGNQRFDLVTWPGHLSYSGDMGDYTFDRLFDMFQFFRTDRRSAGERLGINLHYWAEKVQASDRRHGLTCFDGERFEEVVREQRLEWIKRSARLGTLNKAERRDLWEAIEDEVLSHSDDGEHEATSAALDFSHGAGGKVYRFEDLWEHRLTAFAGHYVWCCYAIAWGIAKYDAATATVETEGDGI